MATKSPSRTSRTAGRPAAAAAAPSDTASVAVSARPSADEVARQLTGALRTVRAAAARALGLQLNLVGTGTQQATESLDLERERLRVLVDKAAVGARLQSDYCRPGARRVPPEVTRDGHSTVRQLVDTVTT